MAAPVRIYGFKGEGNYAQIWVADSDDFFLLGHGGNASPFPYNCSYPPGYAEYSPYMLRAERVNNVLMVNIIIQTGKGGDDSCGQFDTGFAGVFYSPSVYRTVLEVGAGGKHDRCDLAHCWLTLG